MARTTQGNNNNIIIIYMRKRSIKAMLFALLSMPSVVYGQTLMTLDQLYALADEQSQSIKTFKTAIETSKLSADLGLVDADINTLHTWQQKPDMSRQAEANNPLLS